MNYLDAFYSLERAADYAMDYADTQKPSTLSKMKLEQERAIAFIQNAAPIVLELLEKIGLTTEELSFKEK